MDSITLADTNAAIVEALPGALIQMRRHPELARSFLLLLDSIDDGDLPPLDELKSRLDLRDHRARYVTQLPAWQQALSPRQLLPFQDQYSAEADAFYGSEASPRIETVAELGDWPIERLIEGGVSEEVVKVARRQLAIHGVRLLTYAKKPPGDRWVILRNDWQVLKSRVASVPLLSLRTATPVQASAQWRAQSVFPTVGDLLVVTQAEATVKLERGDVSDDAATLAEILEAHGLHYAKS